MSRWRIAAGVALVVALAIATAFVVASSFREEPTIAFTEPVAAPSPSPSTTAATVDPDPMPELHNTGEDFERIYLSIEEFRNWLFRNPDPELVGRIYHQDCECFAAMRSDLQTLIRDGVRFSTSHTVVHEVVVLDRDPDVVALKVVDEGTPQVVVDAASGDVVDRGEGWDKRAYRFLLVRDREAWTVRDIVSVPLDLEPPVTPTS